MKKEKYNGFDFHKNHRFLCVDCGDEIIQERINAYWKATGVDPHYLPISRIEWAVLRQEISSYDDVSMTEDELKKYKESQAYSDQVAIFCGVPIRVV